MKSSVLLAALALIALTGCSQLDRSAQAQPTSTPVQIQTPAEVAESSVAEPAPEERPEPAPAVAVADDAAASEQNAQIMYKTLEIAAQVCQQRISLTTSMYQGAQQLGDQKNIALCSQELEMHKEMQGQIQEWLANPEAMRDASVRQRIIARSQEYDYRANTRDMRPSDEIQPELQKYVTYAAWKAGTPEGQAAHQAEIRGIQDNTRAMTDAHNQRMSDLQKQADSRNAAWNNNQRINGEQHRQFVRGINGQYEYVAPDSGQRYWVPGDVNNPRVINSDGTQTELQPYTPH